MGYHYVDTINIPNKTVKDVIKALQEMGEDTPIKDFKINKYHGTFNLAGEKPYTTKIYEFNFLIKENKEGKK